MDYFDAYEEVYSAIERYADEHGHPPTKICIAPALYRWLREMQKESALLNPNEEQTASALNTRFGAIPIEIDELLTPYEIITE
ncbi:MAG: hypothetical protein U0Y96_06650 [Candidatus Kapaibacterium sp.]|nr:hypothetical protein [Bacteroidota bacterium]